MKKSKSLRSSCLLVLLAGLIGHANAAPYPQDGRKIEWVQPSGQKLELRVFGDEYYARTETADGYTVTYSEADGAYHYAGISADGSKLVPLALTADKPVNKAFLPHLDLPKEKIREISQKRHGKADVERQKRWATRVSAVQKMRAAQNGAAVDGVEFAASRIQAAPVVGNKVGLTILVQFPNDPSTTGKDPVTFPTNREKIVRFCNGVGYNEDGNTGSVRDFYFDQSVGRLTYTQSVTPIVTLPKSRDYYNFADYPQNRILRQNSGDLLVTDAVQQLQSINFNFSSLTRDINDRVLATNLFFAGPDSGVFAQGLWPYSTSLPTDINVGTAQAPIYISAYQQTNIEDAAPVIGTFCHENGHLLMDYPDLYDYGGESEGVGNHCLMGAGNYNNDGKTPSPINAYLKDIVGWGNVVDVAPSDSNTTPLPTTGNVAYRLAKPGTPTEYFIVENRGAGDKWAQYSIDKGIAIWHIDETESGNNNEQMTNNLHYEVSLEQADGQFDLENGMNRGDKQDLFDIGTPLFSDGSLPNAKWWDGTSSSVKVQVLGAVGASTKVKFGPVPVNTIVVGSPNGGEVIFLRKSYVISWEANIQGNVKIELYKGDTLASVLSANAPNTGRFVWVVPSVMPYGADYTVKISSLTNPVAAQDSSDAPFIIGAPTFPANNKMPYGWSKPGSAAAGWVVTKSVSYEGAYSLTNKKIGDGKSAGVAYKSNFKAGNVSFFMKASTENGFDYGRFFIDGTPQVLGVNNGTKGITGQTPWLFFTFPLSAGTHTLKWSFEKDDTYASGKDAVWLDGVVLPSTTQEISVQQPVGEDLADGKSVVSFPKTQRDSKSKPIVFTIKNKGKADLTGLKVVKSGANGNDFIVSPIGKRALGNGETTTFEVTFRPNAVGSRTAQIKVLSNDEDEPAFAISLAGTGVGIPKIAIFHPSDEQLKDGKAAINFGFATVKTSGKTKTFTITNKGDAVLKGLKVTRTGPNKGDFTVGPLGVVALDPGDSTTFTVTFKPTRADKRSAELHIASNDSKTGVFDFKVSGTGAPQMFIARTSAATEGSGGAGGIVAAVLGVEVKPITSLEVVKGQKYLAISVAKLPGGVAAGTVEVSSNLLDWYSGKKHTTVLIDDETTLKVRDNVPYSQDAKRYIRLK
ncbi:MAG: M6 family metalloprotease domain-containing protein [Luteolibacter sp.]